MANYCKHCGKEVSEQSNFCEHCGGALREGVNSPTPTIVINNSNMNTNTNVNACTSVLKNKWIALLLCVFLGYFGAHKFYEGRIGAGILYLLTFGLFGIGWFIDTLILLFKPTHYYVR